MDPARKPTLAEREIVGRGAAALAGAIARGELSAEQAVRAHIARVQQVNPSLNAVTTPRFEAAIEEARAADAARARGGRPRGPLDGVPITVKESLDLIGTPSTFGLASRTAAADSDDPHVARLRAAGAIPIAKTNVAQLLLYFESDNPVYGRTNNPWDPARTPGGSSGGEAALVAAGASPLGVGTDIGGSVRVPAAFCGLASLKPTAGRLPDRGRGSIPVGQRAIESQVGFIARHTSDVALALEIANGGRAPEAPGRPLGDSTTVDLAGLRVGVYEDDGLFTSGPAARRAVTEAAALLGRRGARVTRIAPYAPEEGLGFFFTFLFADGFAGARRTLGRDKRDPRIADIGAGASAPAALLPLIRFALRLAGRPQIAHITRHYGARSTDGYWRAVERLDDYRHRFAAALDAPAAGPDGAAPDDMKRPVDVVLCPPAPVPAFRHGAARELTTMGSYTALWNVLGYPAGVVPVTRVRAGEAAGRPAGRDRAARAARAAEVGSAGLPVGVQVVARPWREHVALAAMAAIEAGARASDGYPRCPIDPR